jgi:hypothetical protein
MADHPLHQLSIRTGVVRQPDTGYLLACDPKEAEKTGHIKIFKWHKGTFSDSWANFNAHTICLIADPDFALVFMSANGDYAIHSKRTDVGNIYHDSRPNPKEPRYGDMRSVAEIAGRAYAVGFEGTVFRLADYKKWTRIDDDLPVNFDISAIHGFDASDIYAVGFRGEVWQFDGQKWTRRELPTNMNLTSVKCAEDGTVYTAGHAGILVRGRKDTWTIVDHEEMKDKVWDLEWFEGNLYLSTMSHVYRLDGENLELVNFGDDPPTTCYHLSAAEGVMWSIGTKDVMSFDGANWTRIV